MTAPARLRDEFNLQGIDTARTTLTAGMLALPGIIAASYQYGWTGILTASVFTVGVAQLLKSTGMAFQHWRHMATAQPKPSAAQAHLQVMANRLAGLTGQDPPTVFVHRQYSAMAVADTANNEIHIGGWLLEILDDDEIEWIIAHELDHMRNGRSDSHYRYLADAARRINFGVAAAAMGTELFGVASGMISQGAVAVLPLSYLVLRASINYVEAAISRAKEDRCDSNALRQTRNKDAALSCLQKMWEHATMSEAHAVFVRMGAATLDDLAGPDPADPAEPITIKTPSAWDRLGRMLFHTLLQSHPDGAARHANVERTWTRMQQEGLVPADPAP